ncbi:MAG: Rieske (2Fe-2S) protein [Gammaproteobacteria bacterium]|nr:Rieske (2Fe-2S) protein [Gammaproteobacteria bacterium]
MTFHYACEFNELQNEELKAFTVDNQKVLLIRLGDEVYATEPKCPHMKLPLEKGTVLDSSRIQCKFHHAEFDIKSGKAEQWACFPPGIQALNFIRGQKDLQTYPVKNEEGRILVEV